MEQYNSKGIRKRKYDITQLEKKKYVYNKIHIIFIVVLFIFSLFGIYISITGPGRWWMVWTLLTGVIIINQLHRYVNFLEEECYRKKEDLKDYKNTLGPFIESEKGDNLWKKMQ